ncbi:MAG TPA: hypothetical protein VMS12_02240 [Thermoanaerobaculia bacterium]|nr:hypothetical protein [Thermoanaerobaculia bacterium]
MSFEGIGERAADIGASMASEGPQALFDEIEQLLPEGWRDQIIRFPVTAVVIGVGVGVFLGMKKGDELIAAGSSLIAAAAAANLSKILGQDEEE